MASVTHYEVRKMDAGYGRWHVTAVLDSWPHSRLVVKCETKRESSLIVSCLNAREFTRENTEQLVREHKKGSKGSRTAAMVTHHIHRLFDLAGLGCPEWWMEVYEDLLAEKPTRV